MNASNLSRSTAEQKPDHEETQYNSLASTVILKTSFMDMLYTGQQYNCRVHTSAKAPPSEQQYSAVALR